jgi:hypothetical protein
MRSVWGGQTVRGLAAWCARERCVGSMEIRELVMSARSQMLLVELSRCVDDEKIAYRRSALARRRNTIDATCWKNAGEKREIFMSDACVGLDRSEEGAYNWDNSPGPGNITR